jgi:hypothetical protein
MHPAGVRLADGSAELAHEVRHDHAVAGARARLRRGERGLEGEHRGELGLRAEQGGELGVADQAGEPGMIEGGDHQTSRNTVSPSPCSRMSKR